MRENNILEIVVMLHEPVYRKMWMISEITCFFSSVVAVVGEGVGIDGIQNHRTRYLL
jgi:hypothetical protein